MLQGLTKILLCGILVQKMKQEDYVMMHTVDNLNVVGCSGVSAIGSDAPLMQRLSAFAQNGSAQSRKVFGRVDDPPLQKCFCRFQQEIRGDR